ncbi:MAG: hypothetical protein ABIO44_04945 [Saprospiraceae bacterium]
MKATYLIQNYYNTKMGGGELNIAILANNTKYLIIIFSLMSSDSRTVSKA